MTTIFRMSYFSTTSMYLLLFVEGSSSEDSCDMGVVCSCSATMAAVSNCSAKQHPLLLQLFGTNMARTRNRLLMTALPTAASAAKHRLVKKQ